MKLSSVLSPSEIEKLKRAVIQCCKRIRECSKCPLKLGTSEYACSMTMYPNNEFPDNYYTAIINSLVGMNINIPFIHDVSVTEEDIISVFKEL